MPDSSIRCWLCNSISVEKQSIGIPIEALTPDHFAITDAHYGTTLNIYRCKSCGYKFCPDSDDVTSYYVSLEDKEYERTRAQRSIQARYLLAKIQYYRSQGTLLDIGAGSGILVEQAHCLGFDARGIEPSQWLVKQGKNKNIPIIQGVFPQAISNHTYDVITLIDVLEHVNQPLQLLRDIAQHLNSNGIAVIVTPDAQSLAARVMGKKWWHYRVAHLSYFDQKTLLLALKKAGLEPVAWHRPTWYFPLDYLLLRLGHYLPLIGKLSSMRWAKSINIPLNLCDSWLVFAKKAA